MPTMDGVCAEGQGIDLGVNERILRDRQTAPMPPVPTAQANQIKITPVLNGYHVQVGCQLLAFETTEKFLAELKRYLENPAAVEKEYMSRKYK